MAHMMRVAFHQSGFAFQYRSLMRQRACCCCCFSADCCLLSALPSPQNSLPPPPFFPETAQRPPAGRSAEQLYLGPLLSLSLSRLFVPPRRVSRMLAKTEHLRDERAIHYRAAPPPLLLCWAHKGSLSQLPSLRTCGNSLRAERLESGC